MKKPVILILIVSIFESCWSLDLPPDFLKCKRTDPDVDNCLKTVLQDSFLKLEKGVPELNFPHVIKVPSLTIGEGKGIVHVTQKYYDVEIRNLMRPRVDNLKSYITDTDFKLDCDFFYDELILSGKYDLDGKILIVPIVGTGDFHYTFSNMKALLTVIGTVVDKKGESYIETSEVKVIVDPEKITYDFKNLFKGDKKLGDEVNALLNDNWKDVFFDVKQQYEEAFGAVFKNLANLIFRKVPYEKIFPK